MDVNASLVRRERLARSWTQQHLADTCNLSLRTVQRVERFGSAAPDTVMELCAVLEISQDILVVLPNMDAASQSRLSPAWVITMIVLALLFGITLGAVLMFMLMQ